VPEGHEPLLDEGERQLASLDIAGEELEEVL
jgi:hypothetical protein